MPMPVKKKYDYLIVGSGLFGATFAYMARQHGRRCLVIDKRPVMGGNIRCERIEGINVHCYGAHIFHTDSRRVWDFVNSIVPFNRYTNSPIANFHGELYNLPFNMNTFHQLWGVTSPNEAMARLEEQRSAWEGYGQREPRNLEEQALSLAGRDIYEKLIKGYTEKQWGRPCKELMPFVIKRLPLRFVYDNNYFDDLYQGIPVGGYNPLIAQLLNGADLMADTDFSSNRNELTPLADKIVYTGKIDEFYDYRFGHLEYRTLDFKTQVLDTPNYQGNAVINYTAADVPYTRIIEHKHFEMFGDDVYALPRTVITHEYPLEWKEGTEPFYPINDEKNNNLYLKYRQLAEREENVIFGGRLAEYKYYNMAPIVEKVLDFWKYEGQSKPDSFTSLHLQPNLALF